MEENKESVIGVIEKLALVTDGLQNIFPDGKVICVYELDDEDFKKVQENFRKIDHSHKRFSIDISGIEHVFIHQDFVRTEYKEEIKKEEIKKEEIKIDEPKKQSWIKKVLSSFKGS
jgi:hypothetical protein